MTSKFKIYVGRVIGLLVFSGLVFLPVSKALALTSTFPTTLSTVDNAAGTIIGWKFTIATTSDITLTQVNRPVGATCNTAYLQDSSHNPISSASFVGNTATFSGDLLTAGSVYYIGIKNSNDSTCDFRSATGLSLPWADTYVDWTRGWVSGEYTNYAGGIQSIVFDLYTPPATTTTTTDLSEYGLWGTITTSTSQMISDTLPLWEVALGVLMALMLLFFIAKPVIAGTKWLFKGKWLKF